MSHETPTQDAIVTPPGLTAPAIAAILNDFHRCDPVAIANLFNGRVLCNQELANHPTLPTNATKNLNAPYVSLIGLLNGLLLSIRSPEMITVYYDEDDTVRVNLQGFGTVTCAAVGLSEHLDATFAQRNTFPVPGEDAKREIFTRIGDPATAAAVRMYIEELEKQLAASNVAREQYKTEWEMWEKRANEFAEGRRSNARMLDELKTAICAHGVIGDSYCFCSTRDRDFSNEDAHDPECRDLRRALMRAGVIVAPFVPEKHCGDWWPEAGAKTGFWRITAQDKPVQAVIPGRDVVDSKIPLSLAILRINAGEWVKQ